MTKHDPIIIDPDDLPKQRNPGFVAMINIKSGRHSDRKKAKNKRQCRGKVRHDD